MDASGDAYQRAIKLGRICSRTPVREQKPEEVTAAPPAPPPAPPQEAARSNVVVGNFPVLRPFPFYRAYPRLDDILRIVARFYNVGVNEIVSPRRNPRVMFPRHIVMYLAREMTTRSFPEIGRRIGPRHHTTVMHSAEKIQAMLDNGDEQLRDDIDVLKAAICDDLARRNPVNDEQPR